MFGANQVEEQTDEICRPHQPGQHPHPLTRSESFDPEKPGLKLGWEPQARGLSHPSQLAHSVPVYGGRELSQTLQAEMSISIGPKLDVAIRASPHSDGGKPQPALIRTLDLEHDACSRAQ